MEEGIKIASNTINSELHLNGSVYGVGIYLSDSIELSLSYSVNSYKDSTQVLAIYEVIDSPEWLKNKNIYVVNDENSLILRYIIIINSVISHMTKNYIEDIFSTGKIKSLLDKKKKEDDSAINSTKLNRLKRELLLINKQEKKNYKVEVDPENENCWNIYILNIENNDKINSTMIRLGIEHIHLEIRFGIKFPFSPPACRIVSPRFVVGTGFILSSGSLCMDIISNNNWAPATTVLTLIENIKCLLTDGNAIIDEINYNNIYDYETASALDVNKAHPEWNQQLKKF
jgi:ubiquitin-protein ligase